MTGARGYIVLIPGMTDQVSPSLTYTRALSERAALLNVVRRVCGAIQDNRLKNNKNLSINVNGEVIKVETNLASYLLDRLWANRGSWSATIVN